MTQEHVGPEEVIAAIEQIRAAVVQAENDGDARALRELFADDIAMLPSGNQIHGAGAVEEFHRQLYAEEDFDAAFFIDRIVVVGGLAMETGLYEVRTVSTEDGTDKQVEGRYLYSYEQDASGVWKIHRMSWQSQVVER